MSGVKHTPGPLAIFPERDRQWLWVMDALGTKRVARVVLYDGLEDEMEANARLIAAAPCMFEYILSLAQNGCATAQEIIARATGDRPEKGGAL